MIERSADAFWLFMGLWAIAIPVASYLAWRHFRIGWLQQRLVSLTPPNDSADLIDSEGKEREESILFERMPSKLRLPGRSTSVWLSLCLRRLACRATKLYGAYVTRATKSLSAVACGVLFIVAGLFGWAGEASIILAGVGLLILPLGAAALLSTQSRAQLRTPHPAVYGVLASAIAFHVFQNVTMMSAEFEHRWFLWALLPYGLVLVLACFEGTRLCVLAGAGVALAADACNYFAVAHSTSSTAAIAFIWIPLWNTIIVVPLATFIAWLISRQYHRRSASAPLP